MKRTRSERLEEKLAKLKEKDEFFRNLATPTINQARVYWRRVEQTTGIRRWWNRRKALVSQRKAIRYGMRSSSYFDKYWGIRRDLKRGAEENAGILGYRVRLTKANP